jgi:drug/metabolite transporter superfamily protein YnfA
MDRITALPRGMQLMLLGGVLLLIDTFFHWQTASASFGGVSVSASRNAWHGWGVLVGLLTIVLLVWLAARIAAADIQMPVSDTLAGAVLGVLIVLSTLLKILVDNEFRTTWAWIGLVLAVVIAVGAWLQVTAGGGMETLRSEAAGMKTRGGGSGAPMAPPEASPPQAPPPSSEPAPPPPPMDKDASSP